MVQYAPTIYPVASNVYSFSVDAMTDKAKSVRSESVSAGRGNGSKEVDQLRGQESDRSIVQWMIYPTRSCLHIPRMGVTPNTHE